MAATPFQRRAFLIGLGTGVGTASLVWGAWKSGVSAGSVREPHAVPECCNYVDYDGWTVTNADKDRLTAGPPKGNLSTSGPR